jgi:hypothetical protein
LLEGSFEKKYVIATKTNANVLEATEKPFNPVMG